MNIKIKSLLEDINENLVWYEVNLGDKKKNFHTDLKGVYFIRTNAPISVLRNVKYPIVDSNNHKSIPNIINKNLRLLQCEFVIDNTKMKNMWFTMEKV